MRKAGLLRICSGLFLILCIVWLTVPKVYVHKLIGHHHELIKSSDEPAIQPEVNSDCDFDKYDTPVYFTIFKFINKFLPLKPKEEALVIPFDRKMQKSTITHLPSRASPTV